MSIVQWFWKKMTVFRKNTETYGGWGHAEAQREGDRHREREAETQGERGRMGVGVVVGDWRGEMRPRERG